MRVKGILTAAGGDLSLVAEVSFYYLDLIQPNAFPFHPSLKGLKAILLSADSLGAMEMVQRRGNCERKVFCMGWCCHK